MLKTIDFEAVTVDVVCIEQDETNRVKDDAVRQYMLQAGYTLFTHNVRNDWFFRKGFVPTKGSAK